MTFPSRRLAIFIHGCFWHGHQGCKRATIPATREEFWRAKIERNEARDKRVHSELTELGWRVRIIWECSIAPKALDALADEIEMIPCEKHPKLGFRGKPNARVRRLH